MLEEIGESMIRLKKEKESSYESEANHLTLCSPGFLPVSHFKKRDFFFLSFQPFSGLINDSWSHIIISGSVDKCNLSPLLDSPWKGSGREEMEGGGKEVCMWRKGGHTLYQ